MWTPQVIKWKPDNLRGEIKKNVTEYVFTPDPYLFASFTTAGTGVISNSNRTLAGGNAGGGASSAYATPANNAGVSTTNVPWVAEFTVDALGATVMAIGNAQTEVITSDGVNGGAAWVAGDKIATLRYDAALGNTLGNVAYFRNGVLIHDAAFRGTGFVPTNLYADTAASGRLTIQGDITLMMYAATYKAFRHTGLTMPDAISWPAA